MEVLADLLISLGKILVQVLEPAIWLMAGFWHWFRRWWSRELPEVFTIEEPEPESEPEPELWHPTETPDDTYYFVLIAVLLAVQCVIVWALNA